MVDTSETRKARSGSRDAAISPRNVPSVVARSPLASLGAEELTLSNGTVVCLKRDASNSRQSVSFQAFALGGST